MLEEEDLGVYRDIWDSLPIPVFILDDTPVMVGMNYAVEKMMNLKMNYIYKKRGGDVFRCISSFKEGGCGYSPDCPGCDIRNSVMATLQGNRIFRRQVVLTVKDEDNNEQDVHYLITTFPLNLKEKKFVVLMLEDINEIIRLKSFLPICCNCKKIRDDDQYWKNLETYLHEHADITFSHSLCPECVRKLYPELEINDK